MRPISYLISTSSSSSNDIYDEVSDTEEKIICQLVSNNNYIITHYLNEERVHGSSIPGHVMINRDRLSADRRLFNDYFSENPLYNDDMFRRRFRMGRNLFVHILNSVVNHDNYFVQRMDEVGKLGLSGLQKTTAAMRMLRYSVAADATDEYIKIGESTAIESLKRFRRAVVEVFKDQYILTPNANDVARFFHIGQRRGFPGMLGSLDCMHWRWKNCLTAWVEQYAGRSRSPTIIFEVVADYDLWIWHAFFGLSGSNNDINVLEASNLLDNLAKGIAPTAHYIIQGKEYDMGYYFADGIYPKWSTLVQTIHDP